MGERDQLGFPDTSLRTFRRAVLYRSGRFRWSNAATVWAERGLTARLNQRQNFCPGRVGLAAIRETTNAGLPSTR